MNTREKDRERNRLKYGVDRLREMPENRIYFGIISRCENENHTAYKNYGGRGIKICDRWRTSFDNFLNDMGRIPGPEYSIDRIDNDGDYCPENCRWATVTDQARNRRSNHIIEAFGKSQCMMDWAEEMGLTFQTLKDRLRRGWCVTRSLLTPYQRIRIPDETKSEILKLKTSGLTIKEVSEKFNVGKTSVQKIWANSA